MLSPRLKVILHDLAAVSVAWLLALVARFNFELPPEEFLRPSMQALPLVVVVQAAISWQFGLYRGLWRFASLPDLWNIIRAALLGAVTAGITLFLINRLEGIPRSVLILYPFFAVFLLGGPRFAVPRVERPLVQPAQYPRRAAGDPNRCRQRRGNGHARHAP